MHIVIDAVGIRGHGGAAVLSEFMHWLPKVRPDWKWHVFLVDSNQREFHLKPASENVTIQTTHNGSSFKRLNWINYELLKQLYRLSPDILFSFANMAPAKPVCPQVAYVQQRNALFHSELSFRTIKRFLRLHTLRRHILQGAKASQAVIVQTQSMRQRMIELEPILNNRIHVIPSGYRTLQSNTMVCTHKKETIESSKRPRLIYISHPSEHKNHITLIKALPMIAERFSDVQLLLTLENQNPPNKRYQRFIKEIEKSAKNHGVHNRIIWLGRLEPEEVTFTLSQCNLMVFPSLSESFGLGLAESMAAGCPIVASDLPYAHEVAGRAAFYFNPHEPKSLAETVIKTLSNENRLMQMRQMAKERATRFYYGSIAEKIASIIEYAVE
jgi:glycosyltransferase involved in cell wall biosynthesis